MGQVIDLADKRVEYADRDQAAIDEVISQEILPLFNKRAQELGVPLDHAQFALWLWMLHAMFDSGWTPEEIQQQITEHATLDETANS